MRPHEYLALKFPPNSFEISAALHWIINQVSYLFCISLIHIPGQFFRKHHLEIDLTSEKIDIIHPLRIAKCTWYRPVVWALRFGLIHIKNGHAFRINILHSLAFGAEQVIAPISMQDGNAPPELRKMSTHVF
jgi:hypothetical protein